ncbi:hypothetical protein D9M70_533000 [compost metagenome]
MHRKNAGHAFLQVGLEVADVVGAHDQLVVAFRVHEVEAFGIFIEEGMLAVFDEGALDLLGRAVALGDLHTVGNAAHVDLGHRRALARVEVLGGKHDIELAVDVENVALTDR